MVEGFTLFLVFWPYWFFKETFRPLTGSCVRKMNFLTLYFDVDSLTRMDSGRVKVWTKYVPKGKKGKDFWAHIRNFDKIPIKQYQHYAYSVVLYEFSCPEKTY